MVNLSTTTHTAVKRGKVYTVTGFYLGFTDNDSVIQLFPVNQRVN